MALPRKVFECVKARDMGLCVVRGPYCTGQAQVAHHRANRGAGGSKSLDGYPNLLASCSRCNSWMEECDGADRAELEARGVRVRGDSTHQKTAQRALTTPVRYPGGRWFYLNDDGTRVEIDPHPY